MNQEARILELRQIINSANNAYYIDDDPTLTDAEYDLFFAELKALERELPQLVTHDSPTQTVGGSTSDGRFKKVKHEIPMISLDNQYTESDIAQWCINRERDLGVTNLECSAEPKVDGLAISLIYIDGILVRGATRGRDGIGEDITANVLTMNDIPNTLIGKFPPKLEVRGEAFFLRSDMPRVIRLFEVQSGKKAKNVRNAASGSVRQKDPAITNSRQPRFFPYSMHVENFEALQIFTHTQSLAYLDTIGFNTKKYNQHLNTPKGLQSLIDIVFDFLLEMPSLDLPCDGYVVKINNLNHQDELGTTSRIPRWAFAAKPEVFHSEKTELISCDFQTSRHGTITPVANIAPVELEGTTVSRATLHNFEEIERLNIAIGDIIEIKKGGGVIPDIIGVYEKSNAENRTTIKPPSECPACGGIVTKVHGRVAYRCTNSLNCSAQTSERIIHYASKEGMNILDLGRSTIEQLCEFGHLTVPSDLYLLTRAHLAILPGFKDKKFDKVLNGIEASKQVDFYRFLTAIGIPDIGKERARELASRFKRPEVFAIASIDEIKQMKGFKELAYVIVDFFKNEKNKREYETLVSLLNIKEIEEVEQSLEGVSFVVTGSFGTVSRNDIQNHIKRHGGKVGSPSTNTNYLILGAGGGSKEDKVRALIRDKGVDIKILSEDEAISLLGIA